MSAPTRPPLDADGPGAPPRANGELVFEHPWESRIFGLTLGLCEQGVFAWDEFREHLIAEIARWEAASPGDEYRYYERWLAAFERLVESRGLCARDEVDALAGRYAARPHGHDHAHGPSHEHDSDYDFD